MAEDRERSRSPPRKLEHGGVGGERVKGTVVAWNARGFGFIKPEEGEDLFCHCSQIRDGNALEPNATVEYEAIFDETRKKHRAVEVTGGIYQERQERYQPQERYYPRNEERYYPREERYERERYDDRRDDRRYYDDRRRPPYDDYRYDERYRPEYAYDRRDDRRY